MPYMAKLNSYYDSYFSKLSNAADLQSFEIHARRYAYNFDRFLEGINKKGACLDIGCGVGQFLYYLRKSGFQDLYGVDMDQNMVEITKKMVPEAKISWSGLSSFLESQEKTFHIISMNDVIEHLEPSEIVPTLRKVRQTMEESGVLLIKTPNLSNPISVNARYKDFTHKTGFTESSLEQVLVEADFRKFEFYEEEAPSTSWRAAIRKALILGSARRLLRLRYYAWEISPIPKILTQWIICRAFK